MLQSALQSFRADEGCLGYWQVVNDCLGGCRGPGVPWHIHTQGVHRPGQCLGCLPLGGGGPRLGMQRGMPSRAPPSLKARTPSHAAHCRSSQPSTTLCAHSHGVAWHHSRAVVLAAGCRGPQLPVRGGGGRQLGLTLCWPFDPFYSPQ